MKPYFSAEYNPDIFHCFPALCWMRMEDESGKPAGTVVQFLFLNLTFQWFWSEPDA